MGSKSLNRRVLRSKKYATKEFNNQIKAYQNWIMLQNAKLRRRKEKLGDGNEFDFDIDDNIEANDKVTGKRDYQRNHINMYSGNYDAV